MEVDYIEYMSKKRIDAIVKESYPSHRLSGGTFYAPTLLEIINSTKKTFRPTKFSDSCDCILPTRFNKTRCGLTLKLFTYQN